MSLDLLTKLREFNSVQLQVETSCWKHAIRLCGRPLVKANTIKESYLESIIEATEKLGPYYIICDGVAMPHSTDRESILADSFSLLTLRSPITFPGDERKIDTLLLLAVKDTDTHTAVALPQIVALFEEEETRSQIASATSLEEIFKLISSVDYQRYLN